MSLNTKQSLGISLGDPGGIGYEITLKALLALSKTVDLRTITLFGKEALLTHPQLAPIWDSLPIKPKIVNCSEENQEIDLSTESATNGQIAIDAIQKAISFFKNGKISALTTAPINKKSLHLAKSPYTGHTTLLQDAFDNTPVSMGFYTPTLKTVLATIHIPLSKVSSQLNRDLLETTLNNTLSFCELLGIEKPKIALAGLNPHAGEDGLFGQEEQRTLSPFVKAMQEKKHPIEGPFSPDTLYKRQLDGEFNMSISLYHDQGLIPIKLMGFGKAVNVTLGLPMIRTSPDHGTAFDIAYQDKANPNSMKSAIELALSLLKETHKNE
jgi:4-hydroxythreonine-4-phosphate dehydrogenase